MRKEVRDTKARKYREDIMRQNTRNENGQEGNHYERRYRREGRLEGEGDRVESREKGEKNREGGWYS